MTVTLSTLTATDPTGALVWAHLFSYQLPVRQGPGPDEVLEAVTEGRREPGYTYRWTDYEVPVVEVPAVLLDTEHAAEVAGGRIVGFAGVDPSSLLAGGVTAAAVLTEPRPVTPLVGVEELLDAA